MPKTANLRHRITLQAKTQTPDEAGGYTTTWQNITNLWANIKPIKSNHTLQNNKQTTTTTHEIKIRYRTDISRDMRFTYNQKTFSILSTQDREGKKQWLTCICKELE